MPKRVHEDSEEERWLRKKKKYDKKLQKKRRKRERSAHRRIISSDEEDKEGVEDQPETDNTVNNTTNNNENNSNMGSTASAGTTAEADPPGSSGPDGPPVDVNTMDNETVEVPGIFDLNLLRELGDMETDPVEYGDELQTGVANGLQKILQCGLKKEIKEELLRKYQFPSNVTYTKGPTLNPEIGAMLAETCKQRDKRLLVKQDQLGKCLSALGKALSDLLKKKPDIPEVIRTLNDTSKLLADSHYAETDTRRSVIIPLIDKSLSDPFKDRKRDHFLFGEKLGDLVKDSRGIKKTGQLIQAPQSSNANLNGRGSSTRPARQQRGGTTYQHRAGGPRTTHPYQHQYQYPYGYGSRRRTAPPPPPPARRPPPPPPPPPRRSQGPAHQRTAARR